MMEENELAIKELKFNEAAEIDYLNGNLLIVLEGIGKVERSNIVTNAHNTAEVTVELNKFVIILLPKKRDEKCEEYKTVSIISQTS